MNLEPIYEKNYKKLLLLSIGLFLISLIILGVRYTTTGELVKRDISLKGGVSVTIYQENINLNQIEPSLKEKFPDINIRTLTDISTRRNIGIIVDSSTTDEGSLKKELKSLIGFEERDYSSETTGSGFGKEFYNGLIKALLFAFIFMAIVVFITFRTFVPSLAVVLSVLMDIVVTLTIVSLINVELSSAGIVAFLLVIGYSVDTDILQTTRVLRNRQGSLYERLKGSMKTGLTMTSAAIVALFVGFIFSTSPLIKQMFLIILIALVVDLIATYVGNASMLIWYCKKKNIT